ncbi:hypothetical protein PUNSTDRAFT_130386 [Punctularia strigosozonata HHB-11173 SS5]|uniref:uncharacterized protein n=1 Tax=Punctularia strigosozonata (strain HHB-11173) TaxID=741275 RepID=UPI0004416D40|nr:uncharacterized protein PUNSTDRAFT_130386 [Punctularia strigosozonata HHB-11173 SS5]EIN12113.1 hypothetical protein PUNSTDRAFT_130386 [Punctularia strigosozonata HHB-11173 SS5]
MSESAISALEDLSTETLRLLLEQLEPANTDAGTGPSRQSSLTAPGIATSVSGDSTSSKRKAEEELSSTRRSKRIRQKLQRKPTERSLREKIQYAWWLLESNRTHHPICDPCRKMRLQCEGKPADGPCTFCARDGYDSDCVTYTTIEASRSLPVVLRNLKYQMELLTELIDIHEQLRSPLVEMLITMHDDLAERFDELLPMLGGAGA